MASEPRRTRRGPRSAAATGRKTKADISRDRVLQAAAQIFAERGYAGTTIRGVAQRVGLQAGSLYYHYRSKEELIEAVLFTAINGISEGVRTAVAAVPADASARQRISTAILAHLNCLVAYGDYALATRRVLGQVPPHVRRKNVGLRDAYGDFWLSLIENAQATGELRANVNLHLARTFVLGALNYALEWYKPSGKPIDEIADQFCRMICEGIFDPPGR